MSPHFLSNIKTQACEDQTSEEPRFLCKRRISSDIDELQGYKRLKRQEEPKSLAERAGVMLAIMTPPRT